MSNNQLPKGQQLGDSKQQSEQKVQPKQELITPDDPRFRPWLSQMSQLMLEREAMRRQSVTTPQILPTSPPSDDSL